MGRFRFFAKNEGIRSAAARGVAREPRGDGRERRGPSSSENLPPKLTQRRLNKHSTIKSGRAIGGSRERVETANERLEARKKVKKRQNLRIVFTVVGFLIFFAIVAIVVVNFIKQREENEAETSPTTVVKTYKPTIEVLDYNSGTITSRMSEYIGQLESDLRDLNLNPTKAVIPAGSIREVDFYLDGHNGYLKTTIDRESAVTAEDTDRMLRYLASIGVADFEYIDVRIDGKAYWR